MSNKHPKLNLKIEKIKKIDQLSKIKDDLLTCLEYFFKSERSDKMPNDPVEVSSWEWCVTGTNKLSWRCLIKRNRIMGLMVNCYMILKRKSKTMNFLSEKKINISKNAKNSLMKYYKKID